MSTAPLGSADRIVVAGAGLAGAQVCVRLRSVGFAGRITLVGNEVHEPYDRPPLSKGVLVGTTDSTHLAYDWSGLEVELVLGRVVTGLREGDQVLETDGGDIAFDGLAIATGASPVRLSGEGDQVTLRTIDDARNLRDRLQPNARITIVGASWIGAEVATAAVKLGCAVTCIEAGPAPLAQALGEGIGKETIAWWEDVDLRLGTGVTSIDHGGLSLSDGSFLRADVVVVGVGVRPATTFLSQSSVACERGVLTDPWLRTNIPGIVAVGDVARWRSQRFGGHMGAEHWDHALRASEVAATSLIRGHAEPGEADAAYDPVPFFWSDQWGHTMQYVGHHTNDDRQVARRSSDSSGWSVGWLAADGRLTALLAVDRPKDMAQARRAIGAGMSPDPDLLSDASVAIRDLR